MQPEFTSDLSRRQWRWLCDSVGEPVALRALAAATSRGRRPWPFNAARELGLKLPIEAALPPVPQSTTPQEAQAARDRLRDLRRGFGATPPRKTRP